MLIFDDYLIEKDDSIVGYCKLAKTIRDASAKRMGIRFIHVDGGLIQNVILHTVVLFTFSYFTVSTVSFTLLNLPLSIIFNV